MYPLMDAVGAKELIMNQLTFTLLYLIFCKILNIFKYAKKKVCESDRRVYYLGFVILKKLEVLM